jgi:protein-S-isoprenylcysteine O-methyltransferase Ste14
MQTFRLVLRSLVYMTPFVAAFGWLAMQVRALDEKFGCALPSWLKFPGMFLLVAGGMIALSCACVFIARGRGTPAVFDPPRQFVVIGPYEFVRNPMYLGGLSTLVGFGFWLRSISILLLALVLLVVVHLFVVFYEEPGLAKRFGQSYLDYKRITHRWLPKFHKHSAAPKHDAHSGV